MALDHAPLAANAIDPAAVPTLMLLPAWSGTYLPPRTTISTGCFPVPPSNQATFSTNYPTPPPIDLKLRHRVTLSTGTKSR